MFDNKSPYTLRTEVVEGMSKYYVSFVDGENIKRETEVSLSVYEAFLSFVKIERNLRRWYERHVDKLELSEDTLYTTKMETSKSVEERVFDKMRLNGIFLAAQTVTEVQRRRFFLHHVFGFTYEEIAEMEGCSAQAANKSVLLAEEKIKEKCKKFLK